jgi:Fic family protein
MSQNWIGGSHLSDAVFIPPHHDEIPELMSDLERFWHNTTIQIPHLINIAISYYQFATIHPFFDGNGRIGRLLIILYLVNFRILNRPSLFLSAFFEKHHSSYYDALSRVRESKDLTHWVKFFLNGIIHTSTKAQETFKEILELRENLEQKILTLKRKAHNAQTLLHFLYKKPVFRASDSTRESGLSTTTVNMLIQDFRHMGIMKEITGKRRNRVYVFHTYLKLFMELTPTGRTL